MEEEKVEKVVNITPISKGKRILAFLADFFLTFIFCFVLFNALVQPVSNAIVDSNKRDERSESAAINQFYILYNQKVLLHENDEDKFAYNDNVDFTLNCYLSYYSFNDEDTLTAHPMYGHKEDNEIIKHFFFDIRGDKDKYISILQSFNGKYPYFNIENYNISLVDNVKNEVRLYYFSPEDMSSSGQEIIANLQNQFMNMYAEVFKDIEANDLLDNGKSYLEYKEIVRQTELEFQWQLVATSLISFILSIAIYYFAIPFFNKDNKTIGMMMMRLQRIGTNNLFTLNKVEVLLNAVYMIALDIAIVFFMPMTYVSFTYLFNLAVLPALLFIGLLLIVASLICLLISPFNRTITDYLSRSVLIKNDDLDAIYRSKGYEV